MKINEIKKYDAGVQLDIGQRIQNLRISKGIAGVTLAAELDICRNQLSRIENGRANCTLSQLFVLAQVLDCSLDFLVFGKEDKLEISNAQMEAVKKMIEVFGQ